jgi:putative N6-adenine-specific DNA methylase
MKFVAKTLYGLEKVLAGELASLGASGISAVNRAVVFEGDKYLMYRVNYCVRTALSVLMPIDEFRIRSKDDLYKRSSHVEWDKYLGPDDTFSVVPVVNSPHFDHSGYAGLVLKDAIADFFRKKTGRRPSVNTTDPALVINLHISNDLVTISLDSSVIPLFKRGYRKEQSVAPLNEVLAAGILLISGWNGTSDLLDPMCGSGTFPIEAGLIACNIPPGKFRKHFGFFRWKDYDEELFEKVKDDCDKVKAVPSVRISGSDLSEKAIDQSKANISEAGLNEIITLNVSDFKDIRTSGSSEALFLNPPYGVRLALEENRLGLTARQGNNIGSEICTRVGYKIGKHTDISLNGAYAVLGDFFDGTATGGQDPDNQYEVYTMLNVFF